MLINFEVLASSSIKRKKPWPQLVWLGKGHGSLFLLDSHRVSQLYLPSGKTRKKIPSLQNFLSDAQFLSTSPNGQYLAGALNSGKIFIWHKDTESVKITAVLDKVRNVPSERNKKIKLFVSDDGDRVFLCVGDNGIFLWESGADRHSTNGSSQLTGTWVQIHNGDHQLPGEWEKEAAVDCVFFCDPVFGTCATAAWVFNQGDKIHITMLHLKWLNATAQGFPGDFISTELQRGQEEGPSFSPQWFSTSRPLYGLVLSERGIKPRKAYVARLSPDGQVLAVALNQKNAAHTCMMFYSTSPSAVAVLSDLKGCGANTGAKKQPMGRTWWIANMAWTRDSVLLVCITRRGSVAVLTKLGEPVHISTCGCSMDIGPALFLPLHPKIDFQKQQDNVSADLSESSLSERNPLSQRFSVTVHPTLPLLVTSDGYGVTVLQFPSVACYPGVISALTQDVVNLLPEIDVKPGNLSRFSSVSKINIMQFEGTLSRGMSAEFLEDRASESDSMSSTGFLAGFGLASGEQGVGFFGLQSMELSEPKAVLPGSREAVLRAQNVSLMALALGCTCGPNWKKSTISALDTHLNSVVKILQILLRSNESATGKQKYSPKTLPRAHKEFAVEGPSAGTSQVGMQEAFKFFRMAMELFQWDCTHKNMFSCAVRLTHALVRELLAAVDVADVSKISACVDVLALSERVLRRVYSLSSDVRRHEGRVEESTATGGELEEGERQIKGIGTRKPETEESPKKPQVKSDANEAKLPVEGDTQHKESISSVRETAERRQKEATSAASQPKLTLEGETQREESTTDAPKTVDGEVETNQQETNRVGGHLSGPWLLLYNYTSTSCRKLFKKKAGYSLQSLREGTRGSAAEQQLVTLLCQIQEKLQDIGVKIPSHSTVQKEVMKEMKQQPLGHVPGINGAFPGSHSPALISLYDPSKQDSLFKRKRAAQPGTPVKDEFKSAQSSPVLQSAEGRRSTGRTALSSDKSRVGLEAFSQTEQDQQVLLSILYLHLQEYNLKSALEVVYSLIEPAVSFEQMVVELNASFAPNAPRAFFSASQDLGLKKLLRVLLQDYPLARVSEKCGVPVVQTLARFMAAYFSNLPLYSYPPNCPLPLPPFYFGQADVVEAADLEALLLTRSPDLQPLGRGKISRAVRDQNLDDLWSANSALELMLVSGLLTEGAWLARNLGDWKNAFLLSFADDVIHGSSQDFDKEAFQSYPEIPECLKPEAIALTKLNPTFQDQFAKRVSGGKATPKRKWSFSSLHEPDQELHIDNKSVSNVSNVLKASLIAGLDLVPLLLARLLDGLKESISTLHWVVPAEFYLPAPPLYCPQPPHDTKESLPVSVQQEQRVRSEAAMLVQQILMLLFASGSAQACVRWYCEQLVSAVETWYEDGAEVVMPPALATQATQGFDFKSAAVRSTESPSKRKGPSDTAKSRLSGCKPSDQESLPSSIASVVRGFREFCILMWLLYTRDKTSLCSRKYRRLRSQNAENSKEDTDSRCLDTLLWTAKLVPFTSFLGASGEIHDALLTLLSDMQPSLASVGVAAQFFRDPDAVDTTTGKAKLKRLITRFRGITLGEVQGIEDTTSDHPVSGFYRQKCSEWSKDVARRELLFGRAPEQLFTQADGKPKPCTATSVGAIVFETSPAYFKFLDTFFLVAFTKAVNQYPSSSLAPLLLPFAKTLVASDVNALAKLKNKADTESATKPPPVTRLARSQSFTDVRTSKPLTSIDKTSQLKSKPVADIRRSSSLSDVNKVGETSGMNVLGTKILEFLPKLVWLSRWSTESSPSHTSEGQAAMRVNVPLPLLVNCLWLLRNVYLAWACNAKVHVDITVQRGDLLNVTETSPTGEAATPHGARSERAKPKKRLEQLYRLPKSYSDPNIPEIVVLSPTTEEEEILASLKVEKGSNKKGGKSREDMTAPPVKYYSDSEFALSSAPVGDLRESVAKPRRNRPPPRGKTPTEARNRSHAPRKDCKENRPVSVPSSPSDSFKHAGRPSKEKARKLHKEKQRERAQLAAVELAESSAGRTSQDTSQAAEDSSSDSSSYRPQPAFVTQSEGRLSQSEGRRTPSEGRLTPSEGRHTPSEGRLSQSERRRPEVQELSRASDRVSSRESLPSGDMEVFLVLRPREDSGAYQSGLPVLRMPAVVGNGQVVSEQEKEGFQHTESRKRTSSSQTAPLYNSLRSFQTQTLPQEDVVPDESSDQDVGLLHARLPARLQRKTVCSSQTQTDGSPENLTRIRGRTAQEIYPEVFDRPPQNTVCSSQTQTDGLPETFAQNERNTPNPAASSHQHNGKIKLAWLPFTEGARFPGPAAPTPFHLLSLPGKHPAESTASRSQPNAASTNKTSSHQIFSHLHNVTGQEPSNTGHMTKPNFPEVPIQKNALPLLHMLESAPSPRKLDLSKLNLLEMTSQPPSWKSLRMPDIPTDATGSDKVKFRGNQQRDSTSGRPLLHKPERQTQMPDLSKLKLLRNSPPPPMRLAQLQLLELQKRSDPPELVPLQTLLAFERKKKEKELPLRDANLMSEKENVRPTPSAPSTSDKPKSEGDLRQSESAPELIHVKGPRWKERDADERNTPSRQRRRQKQETSEKPAKQAKAERRSDHPTKESRVIVVQPAQKRRKYEHKKNTEPAQEPSTTMKKEKGKKKNDNNTEPAHENSITGRKEKSESREALLSLSDESELVLSDISEDLELSDEEEKYFRVEKSPRPLHSPELEEDVLREYKRAVRSLPSTNSKGEATSIGAKGKRPLQHHRTRGQDAAMQSPSPAKLAESISRKLEQLDYEVKPVKPVIHQRKEPITREKIVGVHFADELPLKPAYVNRKAVGIQVDSAEKFSEEETPKPARDTSVAAGIPEIASIATANVGAQTEELQSKSERLPQTHAPVLPPDIFLNLKFPKLDPSNSDTEMDTQTVLGGATFSDDGARSGVAPKRHFLSVADMDSKQWSEIQATPKSDTDGRQWADTRETPSAVSREGEEGMADAGLDQESDSVFSEERNFPEPTTGELHRPDKQHPHGLKGSDADHKGSDAVTVGLLDSLDSTKPHRFDPGTFPVSSQPDARTISRQRLSQQLGEMHDQLNAIDQVSQNMEREFQSSAMLLRAIQSIGQVMTPEETSLNGRHGSTKRDKPKPRLWAGVVPRRSAEKTSDDERSPSDKVAEGIDQSTGVDDGVDVNETTESLHEESDKSEPSTRGSGAETVSERENRNESSHGSIDAGESVETLKPESLHSTDAQDKSVNRKMPEIEIKTNVSSSKEPWRGGDSLGSTLDIDSSDRHRSPERRKELKTWMAKKRSEQHNKWKSELNDTRDKEYQPYVPTTQGSTFKKIKLAEKERGEKRRERESEHLSERMKDASSLIGELLAEEIPKSKEQPNLRYHPIKTSQHKSITERKKKVNQRYGKRPTTRRQNIIKSQQQLTRETKPQDASQIITTANTGFTIQTYEQQKRVKAHQPEGRLSERARGSRDGYVTSRSVDRRSNLVVDDDVDEHVMVSGVTPDEDYWRSSSPGGAEFVTNATYRRHQHEKSRRSLEREAMGFLGFEKSLSRSQNGLTRTQQRPGPQALPGYISTLTDIDRLLDDISADGSTLNEENIESLMNEDDELRDLLGDVLGRRSDSGPGAELDLLTKTIRRGDIPTAEGIGTPVQRDYFTERAPVGSNRDQRNGAAAWRNRGSAARITDSRRTGTRSHTATKTPISHEVDNLLGPLNTADNAGVSDNVAQLLAEARQAIGDDLSESSGSVMSNIDWDAVDRIMNDV